MDAFGKAFGFYKEGGTQRRVEIALKDLANCSGEKPFKAALSELLLKHRLCVFTIELYLNLTISNYCHSFSPF